MTSIVASAVLTAGLGFNIGFVSAAETENIQSVEQQESLTNEEINSLKEFFNTYKVDQQTQDKLIKKLNEGNVWDSLKKDEQPVRTYDVEIKENVFETIAEYKDGSIVVTVIEPTIIEKVEPTNLGDVSVSTPGTISPLAVDPGTISSGSGYSNYKKAKAYVYTGIANAHFYADFTLVAGSYNDYISRVYDYKIVGIGGTATYDNLKITRQHESLNGKASAKLDFTWVAFNGASSSTCWLKLNVGGNTYGTTYSY